MPKITTYLIATIVHGQFKGSLNFQHEGEYSLEKVFEYLKERWMGQSITADPLLEGHNFRYVTNGSHYAAAGYPDDTFAGNYPSLRGPAHFNPQFYQVLRSNTFDE